MKNNTTDEKIKRVINQLGEVCNGLVKLDEDAPLGQIKRGKQLMGLLFPAMEILKDISNWVDIKDSKWGY